MVLALGIGLWRLWHYYYGTTPRFNYVLVEKNDSLLKILNGESLRLHPRDKLAIRTISTTLYINYGIRLACTGLDINAFRYGAPVFSDLLPAETSMQPHQFRVFVKHFNEDLGYFDILSEPHVEDWLEKAARIIDKKRKAAFLLDALNRFPEDRQIRERLVEAYVSAGQHGEAARLLEKEVEEDPNPDTLIELLQLYEKTSNKKGTLAVLNKLVDQKPDQVDFRLRLAQSLEDAGEKKKAIKVYDSILPSVGKEDRLAIHQTLGLLYSETGQPQKALSAYLKALELDQKDANIYYNLSHLYERVGKKDLSDQYLEKALSLKVQDLEGRLKLAERLIEKKRYKEAEKHLKQVLKKDPNSLRALLLMISIMEKTGDKEQLKVFYKKALAQDPDNATLIYNLGILHYETGDLKLSRPYFEKYSKLFPKDKDVQSFLFDIYKKSGDKSMAFREAQVLLRLDRKKTEPYHFIFTYLNDRKEYSKLIGIMEKGMETFPNNTDIRQYLVVAYLKTGQEKKAVDQLGTLLKTKPKDVGLWLQLAQLQEKLGNIRGALQSLEKALEISPDHKTAKASYLGLLTRQATQQEDAGRLPDAIKSYKKILEYDPGNEEAQEAYLRLRLKAL